MKAILSLVVLVLASVGVQAQCAMCRTTIVNNVSHGELALAEGLNFGIIYLFASPYVAIGAVAIVIVYKFRQHAKSKSIHSRL